MAHHEVPCSCLDDTAGGRGTALHGATYATVLPFVTLSTKLFCRAICSCCQHGDERLLSTRGIARNRSSVAGGGVDGEPFAAQPASAKAWVAAAVARHGRIDALVNNAGVAVFKRAYQIFQERGYRTRLLSAAFRNHHHWSQLIGGDIVVSPPFNWQEKANESGITGEPRMHLPVAEEIMTELFKIGPEFHKAYDPEGMTHEEFNTYGATVRTLRQFLQANNDLEALVRDVLAELDAICARRGVRAGVEETMRAAAAPSAPEWQARWERAVSALGVPLFRLPSGAGHDAMKLHEVMPQAMLFVRGENAGISHNPLESTTSDDMQLCVDAFTHVLNQLALEKA